jgi:hypothetical protein
MLPYQRRSRSRYDKKTFSLIERVERKWPNGRGFTATVGLVALRAMPADTINDHDPRAAS